MLAAAYNSSTADTPQPSERGITRSGLRISPAAIGRLFQPSNAHSAASTASPKPDQLFQPADEPGPPRCSQLVPAPRVRIAAASPNTITIFTAVITVCTAPPNWTEKQFNNVKKPMIAIAISS